MWSWEKKNKLDNLETQNHILRNEIETLNIKLKNAQSFIDKINDDIGKSSFVFDFKGMKVFSVERNISDNRPVTIIGYLLPEPFTTEENGVVTKDTIREWFLYCDQERHEKLVEEFKKSLK